MRVRIWIAMVVLLLAGAFASLVAYTPAAASGSLFLRSASLPLEGSAVHIER